MPESTGSQLLSDEAVLTTEEVARILRVSESTVKNLYRTGQLHGCLIGKHLRFRPCDVTDLIEKLGSEEP